MRFPPVRAIIVRERWSFLAEKRLYSLSAILGRLQQAHTDPLLNESPDQASDPSLCVQPLSRDGAQWDLSLADFVLPHQHGL